MKFCPNCGKEMADNDVMCLNCCYVVPTANTTVKEPIQESKPSIVLAILSFMIPIVGFILAIVNRKKASKASKIYLNCALSGMAFAFATLIVNFL